MFPRDILRLDTHYLLIWKKHVIAYHYNDSCLQIHAFIVSNITAIIHAMSVSLLFLLNAQSYSTTLKTCAFPKIPFFGISQLFYLITLVQPGTITKIEYDKNQEDW